MQGQINDCRYSWFLTNTSARFYTDFDSTAQSRVEFSPVTISGDGSITLSYSPTALGSQNVLIGGQGLFVRVLDDGSVQFSAEDSGGTRVFRTLQSAGSQVVANQPNAISLSREGDLFRINVNGQELATTVVGVNFSFSLIGQRLQPSVQFGSGYIYDVVATSAGTELLNMPIDQNYTPTETFVNNTVASFGDNEFVPSRVAGGWTDEGGGVYRKAAGVTGDLGEFYTVSPLQPSTTYRMRFTVNSDGSTLNIFTRDGGTSIATVTGLSSGDHDIAVTTGDVGGLWFARTAFNGTVSNVRIERVIGNSGTFVNVADGDSTQTPPFV